MRCSCSSPVILLAFAVVACQSERPSPTQPVIPTAPDLAVEPGPIEVSVWPILNAVDINDRGVVVGQLPMWPKRAGLRNPDGSTVTIDLMPGDDWNEPWAINNRGQVVGYAGNTALGGAHAFIWHAETGPRFLGTFGGGYELPLSISERGVVVGVAILPPGGPVSTTAFMWTQARGLVDLGQLLGSPAWSSAWDVDIQGRVVGSSANGPWMWSADELTWLPLGPNDVARGINRHGVVTGYFEAIDGRHAFKWSKAAGLVDLGMLGASIEPRRIADDGTIVGQWNTPGYASVRAFSGRGRWLQDLGDWSSAFGVNNCGVASGWSSGGLPTNPSYGAIWVPRGRPLTGACP